MKKVVTISFLFLIVLIGLSPSSAQALKHPGIDLYQAGKNQEAVNSLSKAVKEKAYESKGEIWNYLGLAYIGIDELKKARTALERAVKLSPDVSVYRSNLAYTYVKSRQFGKARSEATTAITLDPKNKTAYYMRGSAFLAEGKLDEAENDASMATTLSPDYPQGYLLKSRISVTVFGQRVSSGSDPKGEIALLKDAVDILSTGVENCTNSPNRNLVEDELESIRAFYDYFKRERPGSLTPTPAPVPGFSLLKILSKPRASYTDSARQAGVQGTIRIAVLFGASGKVEQAMLIKRLEDSLDAKALTAARGIGFTPQMKDGKPVPVVRMVEYSFSTSGFKP